MTLFAWSSPTIIVLASYLLNSFLGYKIVSAKR